MKVEERIRDSAKALTAGVTVERICIGVGYTAVILSDGRGGVSYTFRDALGSSCGVLQGAGKVAGIPAVQALDWIGNPNLARAAIGIATANALFNGRFRRGANIAEAVTCEPDDVVGMIGWFCPLVWKYQEAKSLYIFERHTDGVKPSGKAQILLDDQAYALLPQCNKVVLTGTSFVNGTADELLKACTGAKEIILVGASTPMCPEVLRDYGVTVLAGTAITDAELALRICAEGGGGMDLSPASIKLLERIG